MELKDFLDIEYRYGLNEKRLDGFAYWTFFRRDLVVDIMRLVDKGGEQYVYPARSRLQKIFVRLGTIKYALLYGRVPRENHDVLILNGERRKWNGSYYECLYTDKIALEYPDSIVLERPYFQGHYRPVKTKGLVYTDPIEIKTMLSWYSRQVFHKKQVAQIREVIRDNIREPLAEICKVYQVEYDIEQILDKMVCGYYVYRVKKKEFGKILDRLHPKVILEVVGYNIDCMIVNELAAARHIPTIELQHGATGITHIAYNYYVGTRVVQFPQYYFSFSRYWIDSAAYPLPQGMLREIGFPYFEEKAKIAKSKIKKAFPHQIVFISQPKIGKMLSETAVELNDLIDKEQYKIIFKLHPGEYQRWRESYVGLAVSNIEVIDNDKIDLYELFAASEHQVGAYGSTATFEGLEFGLRTYIMREGAYPILVDLCEKGIARFFDTAQDLYRLITSDAAQLYQGNGFWKENALTNMKREIDAIMNGTDN